LNEVSVRHCPDSLLISSEQSWIKVELEPVLLRGNVAGDDPHANEVIHPALLLGLRQLGLYELHAAAVSFADSALVMVGPSGSGKTSLAAAMLEAGGRYLGDDGILLRLVDGELELLSYPLPFRFTDRTHAAFSKPRAATRSVTEAKWSVDLDIAYPGRHRPSWSERCVVLLPRIGTTTEFRPLAAADILTALIEQSASVVAPLHHDPKRHLATLARLAQQPARGTLQLGPEWLETPRRSAETLLQLLELR
jgi:hypothetical protein